MKPGNITYSVFLFWGLLAMLVIHSGFVDQKPIQKIIKQKVQQLRTTHALDRQFPIIYPNKITEVYHQNNYHQIWNNPLKIRDFTNYLKESYSEGLNPADYHLIEIQQYLKKKNSNARASLDILLTDAFLRYAIHLSSGKIDTSLLKNRWVDSTAIDPVIYLNEIQKKTVSEVISEFAPKETAYHDLKKALAKYRYLDTRGGWQKIPYGSSIHPGDQDNRIPLITKRLIITGDLIDNNNVISSIYDQELRNSVIHYQKRNGLNPDGIIGRLTLESMNIPVTNRINQIRVNLERWRWLPESLGSYYLFINIADFKLYIRKDGKIISQHKIIIGRYYRKTPVLTSHIAYLLFNPDWIVPPTVLKKDLLPLIRKNPAYLQREHFIVMDTNRTVLKTDTINWNNQSAMDYLYLQRPGIMNPLGRVEFIFPSQYKIFMHDTPSQYLFQKNRRMFSSGCIRVSNALELAEYLLNDPYWTIQKMQEIIKTGKTTKVIIRNKPALYIVYFTSWVDKNGTIEFRKDIYHRDAGVLSALNDTNAITLVH